MNIQKPTQTVYVVHHGSAYENWIVGVTDNKDDAVRIVENNNSKWESRWVTEHTLNVEEID